MWWSRFSSNSASKVRAVSRKALAGWFANSSRPEMQVHSEHNQSQRRFLQSVVSMNEESQVALCSDRSLRWPLWAHLRDSPLEVWLLQDVQTWGGIKVISLRRFMKHR